MDELNLIKNFESRKISAQTLLSNLRFFNEDIKKTSEFSDVKNLPFFYHLGKESQFENIIQVGTSYTSSYIGPCILNSCKTVKSYDIVTSGETDTSRLIMMSNFKMFDNCKFRFLDIKGATDKYDCAIVSLRSLAVDFERNLEFMWQHLKDDGLLIANFVKKPLSHNNPDLSKSIFKFAKIKNREYTNFDTRHGIAIIRK